MDAHADAIATVVKVYCCETKLLIPGQCFRIHFSFNLPFQVFIIITPLSGNAEWLTRWTGHASQLLRD